MLVVTYLYRICWIRPIFLYADDILLIALTVSGLQAMLTACERELVNIDMFMLINPNA